MANQTSLLKKTARNRKADKSSNEVVELVRELAWTGQHAKAIDSASQEFGRSRLKHDLQMDLLDLRAESYIAIGKLDLAMKDAKAMMKMGSKVAGLKVQALNRLALVQMRTGDLNGAVKSATTAVKAKHNNPALRAESLFRLSEAQHRTRQREAAIETAQKAIALYQELDDFSGAGRAYWVLALTFSNLNRAEDSRRTAQTALELCEKAGDQYGIGNAMNALTFSDADLAECLQHLQQAHHAFETAGYADRQSVSLGNLALAYLELGLYPHSHRMQSEVVELDRAMGSKVGLTYGLANVIQQELILGDLDSARLHLLEIEKLVPDLGVPSMESIIFFSRANLAFAAGDLKTAIRHQKSAVKIDKEAQTGSEQTTLTELGKMHLAAQDPTAALKATTQATNLHRAQNFAKPDGFTSQAIWWWHAQALNANKKTSEAREALERAYDFLIESISSIRDAGLRRNALNKVEDNRKLLQYWAKIRRGGSRSAPTTYPHLNIESNLREPFKRLADTGLRLNALKTVEEIRTFLVEEATELSGGERVMLILENKTSEVLKTSEVSARAVVESILPLPSYQSGKGYEKAEDPRDVLKRIGKYLDQARQTRTVQLLTPSPALPLKGKGAKSSSPRGRGARGEVLNRIIAPLIAQNQVIGYLYVDMDSLYGSFDDTDRDMMGMLANQGAVALDNAGLLEGLERKVEERTAELQTSNSNLEQRNVELAIINNIQEGLADKLDLKEIYNLVGDKIREIFTADTTYIIQYDHNKKFVYSHYYVDKGKSVPPMELPFGQGMYSKVIQSRKPLNLGTNEAQAKAGALPVTPRGRKQDLNESYLGVPLFAGDEVAGVVSVQSYKQNAFGENDLRLLTTLANAMSVALQNAQSFKAEQERVAELAIINSVQAGLASKLDMQSIYELVGDKIREIFHNADVILGIYDAKTDMADPVYAVEHGKRLTIPPFKVAGIGFMGTMVRKPRAILVNENMAQISEQHGSKTVAGTDLPKSVLYVPMATGETLQGVLVLQDMQNEHAFNESNVRLLETLANSMSVALENARLFKAEQERVAELAVINSVQQGLASKLDMQAIYDLVGDRLRDIFDPQKMFIATLDHATETLHYQYLFEKGKRLYTNPSPFNEFTRHQIQIHQLVVINEDFARRSEQLGMTLVPGTQMPKSGVFVPLVVGDVVRGIVYLANHEHEHAFSDSDVRLLETLANSMSVALQNAQSFKAEQERVAELATINAVQGALAAELDIQGIYDAVGEKLREIFNYQDVSIYSANLKARTMTIEYSFEKGQKSTEPLTVPMNSLYEYAVKADKTLVFNDDFDKFVAQFKDYKIPSGELPKSMLLVPVPHKKEATEWVALTLQDVEGKTVFTESHVRLLETLAASMSVALQNAVSFKAEQERVAELQIINSIQQGLAAELDFQAIVDLVGDKLREVFNTPDLAINWYDANSNLIQPLYYYEHGIRHTIAPYTPSSGGLFETMAKTRQPIVYNTPEDYPSKKLVIPGTDLSKSLAAVPIISSDRAFGSLQLENYEHENAYGESELRLLTTIAASLGTALENARLFDETQRLLKVTEDRAAELAIINSVQEGLASKLEFQAIIDLVGEKLGEVFHSPDLNIRLYNPATNMVHFPYLKEHDERIYLDPRPLDGLAKYVIENRQVVVINENMERRAAEIDAPIIEGTDNEKSLVAVPIITGDRVLGLVNISNFEREHAYTEADVRLLTTLASSMAVALENARLFDETQQRNAELAIINSVQASLAAKLDMQSIYDAVGNKIREIFDAQVVAIVINDKTNNLMHYAYLIEKGQHYTIDPTEPTGISGLIFKTGQTVLINKNLAEREAELLGKPIIQGVVGEASKSRLDVPMMVGNEVRGTISLQNVDRENAFSESDVRLLTTLANSMSVALENARLFDETQRLLKVTEDRAAELAIINSVQQALAAELNIQGIYDAVGDKIREIFNQADVNIRIYDPQTSLLHFPYYYESGQRINIDSMPLPRGITRHILTTRETLVINENLEEVTARYGSITLPGTEVEKSAMYVPLVAGDQARGLISLSDMRHEHAFSDSDVRLLQTLANSMSVALENARLFDETQRLLKVTEERNAELAIINSVQAALAAELNIQGIYDAVGDKIREIFHQTDVNIRIYDTKTNMLHIPYVYENGNRISVDSMPLSDKGFGAHVLRTRETLVINENMAQAYEKYGSYALPGTQIEKSALLVPLIVGEQVRGLINLVDNEREHAFSESDVRLLQTLANSMSVALENARLFNETQRLLKITEERNAELAVINSVQKALAAELDMQGIYDAVGDKVREIFDAQSVIICVFDQTARLRTVPYNWEKGEVFRVLQPLPFNKLSEHLLENKEPLLFDQYSEEVGKKFGLVLTPGTDSMKSGVFVPMVTGGMVTGFISLQNMDKEFAFSKSDVRLLTTLANSMSVALENARLFDETQRLLKVTEERAAELQSINSVQAVLAAELDIESLYETVGEKIREIFSFADVGIRIYDPKTNLIHHPYGFERGRRTTVEPYPLTEKGFTAHVLRTRQLFVVNEKMAETMEKFKAYLLPGTQMTKSAVYVPLVTGEQAFGMIRLSNSERERAFSESDVRLLQTLANAMSVALENARLFNETQRLLQVTEDRAAELAIINSVQAALAAELNIQGIYDAVGDKIREIFHKMDMSIRIYDPQTNLIHFPYCYENGERIEVESQIFGDKGFGSHVIRTRQTLAVNENMDEVQKQYGSYTIPGTQSEKSAVYVPLVAGEQARGLIALGDYEHENAFSESDIRLLETLANSMSVALENARLFDETQRLLRVTEERAQELSIINRVQLGLASKLDMQGIYDLIGEQLRNMFDSQSISIVSFDPENNTRHYHFLLEKGQRIEVPEAPIPTMAQHVIRTKETLLVNENLIENLAALGITVRVVPGTASPRSLLRVPIIANDEVRGMIGLDNIDRENAFSDTDVRLLTTLANGMSVALENARLFNEAQEARAAADKANATKSTFLSNMSHELRTPLNAILGFTRIVRRKAEGVMPEKQIENLDKVLTSGEHLLGLINTVLDIAKIEAGRMDVVPSIFEAGALAEQCVNLATPLLKPGVLLEKQIGETPLTVFSDQDKIKQIVLNLLSNAAKFTHEGRIILNVSQADSTLSIAVQDSGIGISEEALGRVFEEFQQADSSTTRQYGGTGLGLAISRNLARLLGGDLIATSELGKGSTFTLSLPVQYVKPGRAE